MGLTENTIPVSYTHLLLVYLLDCTVIKLLRLVVVGDSIFK